VTLLPLIWFDDIEITARGGVVTSPLLRMLLPSAGSFVRGLGVLRYWTGTNAQDDVMRYLPCAAFPYRLRAARSAAATVEKQGLCRLRRIERLYSIVRNSDGDACAALRDPVRHHWRSRRKTDMNDRMLDSGVCSSRR